MGIEKVYYYNRNGELKLTMNEHPYWLVGGEFKNWEWSYDESFSRFRNFRRSKKEYPLSIMVVDNNKESRDVLCDIFDEDVLAGSPGYLMINGWKLSCYIVEAERSFWAQAVDYQIDFKIITETSTWARESTTSYNGIDTAQSGDLGRDYSMEDGDDGSARGYELPDGGTTDDSCGAYGYSILSNYSRMISLPTNGNGFRVTFYGAVNNPVIYLNGNPVRVLASVASGERLVVTSNGREKTIYKVSAQGEKTDYFVYRDKDYSPFFSIDQNTELAYGEVKFDFTTIESRSEPSWN